MRVLHIYKSYYPETTGGVEQVIHQLCNTLPKFGIQSDVAVASYPVVDVFKSDYPVFRYRTQIKISSCPISYEFYKKFDQLISRYDVIHYHFPWPFADMMQLASQHKKPYLITYHSDIIKQRFLNIPYQSIMHRFFNDAHSIVATSPPYAQTSTVLQKYSHKVKVIPLGLSSTESPSPDHSLMQQWNSQLGNGFFLYIGVLRYYKGIEFLLKAAQHTDARIVIAGAGPEEKRLKKLAASLHLRNVTFLGYISEHDKSALLSLCRAIVAPSHLRSEAFCLALLEGLSYNKPSISTEIGTGTSFVNQHDKTGIVVPPANPIALAEAINRLQSDHAYYEQLQQNIPAHYQADFTAEKMAERYTVIYSGMRS